MGGRLNGWMGRQPGEQIDRMVGWVEMAPANSLSFCNSAIHFLCSVSSGDNV